MTYTHNPCFNLAIEMLIISGWHCCECAGDCLWQFQSRNRDSYHFRAGYSAIRALYGEPFQSRNRDACHFRRKQPEAYQMHVPTGFNLAIEMLVISGDGHHVFLAGEHMIVSISQSRFLSFQDRG